MSSITDHTATRRSSSVGIRRIQTAGTKTSTQVKKDVGGKLEGWLGEE